uniref:Sulfatase N-terminal domain-containing protein n=1 Tax=Aureoumbra lagunensis TaxID=44058 RepID=A0A7S3K2S3_9STRA
MRRLNERLIILLRIIHIYEGIQNEKKNVLWFLIDDLRPQFGRAYGQSETYTPNLDKLAVESVVFKKAYCQLTVCSPSRNSFLTGRRPDSIRVYNFVDHFRITNEGRDSIALPQYFKNNGYYVIGGGKTYQPGKPPDYDGLKSWSEPPLPLTKNLTRCHHVHPRSKRILDVCPEMLARRDFMDERTADHSENAIRRAVASSQPFFVVAGFYRPHLRWHVPQSYYDLYNNNKISVAQNSRFKPHGMPDIAWTSEGCHTLTTLEYGTHQIEMNQPLSLNIAAELRKGYYACVSFIDHLVGRLLTVVNSFQGLRKNTIILVSSDHGFHLGEQASWTKHTLFEHSARVPLMIRFPHLLPPRIIYHPVELVDIYRTLADLAGLPQPPDHIQGRSLRRTALYNTPIRNFSLTQYPRCPKSWDRLWDSNCKRITAKQIPIMGYSLRVNGFRFTEWYQWRDNSIHHSMLSLHSSSDTPAKIIATELYQFDETQIDDADAYERQNLAHIAEAQCSVINFRHALRLLITTCQHSPPQELIPPCELEVSRYIANAQICMI